MRKKLKSLKTFPKPFTCPLKHCGGSACSFLSSPLTLTLLWLADIFSLFYYSFVFMWIGVSPACILAHYLHAWYSQKARRGHCIPWNWSSQAVVSLLIWVLEMNAHLLERAASAHVQGAISLATYFKI